MEAELIRKKKIKQRQKKVKEAVSHEVVSCDDEPPPTPRQKPPKITPLEKKLSEVIRGKAGGSAKPVTQQNKVRIANINLYPLYYYI